jgi:hypothetical protein
MNTSQLKRPWYREPWVWLMIALPASAVVAGMITIYLAVVTSDGLVVDDYYKRGKAINRVLARDMAAARYQLKATIDIDLRDNRVQLLLESAVAELPETLTSMPERVFILALSMSWLVASGICSWRLLTGGCRAVCRSLSQSRWC